MRIIPIEPGHVDVLAALATDTFSETFGHLYPPQDLAAFVAKSYGVSHLLAEIAKPDQYWRLVLDDQGREAGYMNCGPVTLPHPEADRTCQGELKRIYVRQSHQGHGLGKTLVELAMSWMAETYGDAPQWIGVWSGNVKAQALYASYGFERVGEYIFPVGETMDDEFILRRIG